jgi:hypothetical protein
MKKFSGLFVSLVFLLAFFIQPVPVHTEQLGPVLTYTIQEFDGNGNLVSSITRPAHSYVKGMAMYLYAQMAVASPGSSLDTGNTSRAWIAPNANINLGVSDAAAGDTTNGIVAGTGTNAVAQTDYALQTPIGNGAGSGQLMYGDMTFTVMATYEPNSSFTGTRILNNMSGGTITINEIGQYSWMYYGSSTKDYICIARDVVSPGVSVTSGHNVAITYAYAFTY